MERIVATPKYVRKFSNEAWTRIRMLAIAREITTARFLDDVVFRMAEFIDPEEPNFDLAASHVMGPNVYPIDENFDKVVTVGWATINPKLPVLLTKIGPAASGSVEAFLRKALMSIALRIPPSKSVIPKGASRHAKLDHENWDGTVNVASAQAEGDRLE